MGTSWPFAKGCERKRAASVAFEALAWSLGLLLLLVYGAVRGWAEHARAEAVEAFRAQIPMSDFSVRPASHARPAVAPDQSLWSKQRVLAFRRSLAAPGVPEGLLRVPSVQLEVPIYAGTNEINLSRGAAHIEGTTELSQPGNIGIAGHRDGFFRKLKDVKLGEEINLELYGRSLRYEVVDLRIALPSEVGVLAPTEVSSITLVTCFPFYFAGPAPQRYIVRGELVDARTIDSSSANQE